MKRTALKLAKQIVFEYSETTPTEVKSSQQNMLVAKAALAIGELQDFLDAKHSVDHSKVTNIQFEDVDHSDAPDYCDAYIVSAEYEGGEMTEAQLELLNEDKDFVHSKLLEWLH